MLLTSLLTELLRQSVLEDDLSSVRRCGPEGEREKYYRAEGERYHAHYLKEDEVFLLEVDQSSEGGLKSGCRSSCQRQRSEVKRSGGG